VIKNSKILILLIITSCSSNEEVEMVDMEELVVREEVLKEGIEGKYSEGVVYKVNSQKPFTGTAKREYSKFDRVERFKDDGYGLGQFATFKDGKLNGPYVIRGNQNKISIKTNLKGAKIEGFFEEYYPSGQLKVKFKAKDGRVQGRYESYHNNGQLEVITHCNQKVPEYFAFEKYKKFDRNGKEISADYDKSVCIDARIFIFKMGKRNYVSMSSAVGKPPPLLNPDERI
tara:strand:+ start:13719 stop:14405 length:687 start_codon:yes stop_codon:yes gene_type:complete